MTTTGLILAGGDLRPTDRLRAIAARTDFVVAADGGLRHAASLGVAPSVVVGDFDSVAADVLDAYPDTPRQRHPANKGKLDLELAIDEAKRLGADSLVVMGALGTRVDQTLAGLLVCARLQQEGISCTLHGSGVDAYPLAAGQSVRPPADPGTTFSVVSLDDDVLVSIRGARYPADRIRLPFGVGLGVSNVSSTDPEIACHRGLLVVIVDRTSDI